MITKKRKQFYCIAATDPEEFQDKMNSVLSRHLEPEITFPNTPLTAYVVVTTEELAPETLADEYRLQGKSFHCGNCPHLIKSEDKRKRWHYCEHEDGPSREDTPACEDFYRWLKRGDIKPIGKED